MEYTVIGSLVVVIIALCESLKRAGLKARFVPLLSVVLGIGGAFWFDGVNMLATLTGVILGLATTGGYRVVKTSVLNK